MNVLKLLKRSNKKQLMQLTMDDYVLIRDILKKMNIFKINSYDALIIQRDLIGMAHEMKLRGTSLAQEMGDGFDDFIKDVIKNSRGPSYWEIGLTLLKHLSLMIVAFIVIMAWMQRWSPNIALPTYILLFVPLSFLNSGILSPIFIFEKGFKKHIQYIIIVAIYIPLIFQWHLRSRFTVPTIPTLIIPITVFVLTYWGYKKHMSNLSKDAQSLVEDLIK